MIRVANVAKVIVVIALVASLLGVASFSTPRGIEAAPPPPCTPPPPAGVGAQLYHVWATLPVGSPAAAQAVCINVPGATSLNTGAVTQAPLGCPPAVAGAGILGVNNLLWADWGTPCVAPGGTVVMQFLGAPGLPLGHAAGAATWLSATSSLMPGDATVWPAACPSSPPGAGLVLLTATMVAPAGGPYDGVCFFAPAVGGFHGATLLIHPPGCPVNIYGAAVSAVWDDFTTLCANPGDMVKVQFFGPPGAVGTCLACATWLDGAVLGDVTITAAPPGVGGIAQSPDPSNLPAEAQPAQAGARHIWWYVLGGASSILLLAVGAGWYSRRRHTAR